MLSKKIVHFSTWGPRYWNIREMTWRHKMTFLEDRYLEKWSLERINFYSITSSVPVLKKAPIIRNEKLYHWNWQIFNYLKAPFLTNLNPNSVWCQTLLIAQFQLFYIFVFSKILNRTYTTFSTCKKLDVSTENGFSPEWSSMDGYFC